MKKNRITGLLTIVVISIIMIGTASVSICQATEKIPIPRTEKNVYVYDEDNIIEDDIEKQVNALLVELEKKTEVEFAVISVDSLLDLSIEDYSHDLFNELGIGKKEKNNGILLLISRNDKRVRLEVGRGLEGCLNAAKCGRILDNYFVPYREKDEYSKAVDSTVKATMSILAQEYDVTFDDVDVEKYEIENEENIDGTILFLVIVLFILYFIFGDSDHHGGHSGGFFSGGFSSGSSGGGFGGGSTGGVGASR